MRIRTRSLIITASRAMTSAVALIVAVFLVRLVSKEVFGTYRQVMLVATFLVSALGIHLPQSLFYFVPKLGPGKRRLVLSQTLIATASIGLVSAVVMLVGAEWIGRWFKNPGMGQ